MLLSRILGGIGRFCISLGVLTLLFVAYQLWGTGILTAQAQNDLENDFETLLAEAEVIEVPTAAPAAAPTEQPGVDSATPTAAEQAAAAERAEADRLAAEAAAELSAAERELIANLLWRPAGDPVARLNIPAIDLEWTVVEGVGTDPLRDGPGHYPSTPMPGMEGNASIAGHRTTWGAPFNRIDELKPGDIITAQTVQGVFEYRVVEQESGKGHFIVTPDRVDVLDQDFVESPNRLTLTACHPKFSARQRIIVVAELIGEPAPFVPRPASLGGPVEASLASEDFGTESGDAPVDTTDDGTPLPGDPDLIAAEETATEAAEADQAEPANADDGAGAEGEDREPDAGAAPPTGIDDPEQSLQGTFATDDFGEGLNGDRSAIMPAIMWGLAATAIAAAAGFAARRWKKLPSYAMGLIPFALVLFVCFVHIDQALPSY